MTTLITPSKNLGYSNIYLDFLAGADAVKNFYQSQDMEFVSKQIARVKYDREKLVEILRNQNRKYGSSQKAFANIENLKSADSLAIFSGQQAVFFGGPMLIMIKALALVKTAEQYSQKLARAVVPIFWIAGDDHDFEEANHTTVLNKQSEEVTISYHTRPSQEISVAEFGLSDAAELDRANSLYKEALGKSDFTDQLYRLIDKSYQPGETFVTAFGKLLAGLTTEFGLVLFSPGEAAVKKHAVKFFKVLVNKQDEIHQALSSTNRRIQEMGYHLQVQKPDNSAHLFYNLQGRKPVLREGAEFRVVDKIFSKEELLNQIEKEPQKFSPDVLTRPVFQSWLFPVAVQLGGPAEIAYLAQSSPIFELFGLTAPIYRNRPSATFLEKHFEKMMDEYNICFEDLTGDIEQVINRVLAKSFPENLEKEMANLRKNIEFEFEAIKKTSLEFDPSLKDFAQQTFGKMDFTLKQFQEKVFASHKKKSQDVRLRIYRFWHTLFPAKGLQERTLNVGYFLSKYGFGFMNFMYKKIDVSEKSHQLISLSDYPN